MIKPKENFSKIDPRRKTVLENKKEGRYKAFDEVKNWHDQSILSKVKSLKDYELLKKNIY